jgi:hypothetical protein
MERRRQRSVSQCRLDRRNPEKSDASQTIASGLRAPPKSLEPTAHRHMETAARRSVTFKCIAASSLCVTNAGFVTESA